MKVPKEHFEFTAALISAANNGTPAFVLATLAAAKFAKDNPRFDEERFKVACGVDTDVVACVSDTGTVAWADVDKGDTLPPPPKEININD